MRVFLLLITISVSTAAEVTWIPNKSLNLPMNFLDHKLPCSKQTVVFPETLYEDVKIESVFDTSGFILPIDGEIVLDDATINIGAKSDNNCTEERYAYYTPKPTLSWASPDVWSSPRYNKATPDAERMPCYDDEVVFPASSQFTVYLPSVKQYIKKLTVSNRTYNDRFFFIDVLIRSKTAQQFIAQEDLETNLAIANTGCDKAVGCPCQINPLPVDCSEKFCPEPKCQSPIKPIGHCCKICGGFLNFKIDKKFDMLDFKNDVADVISYYGKDKLAYHIGIIPKDTVQLIVVEEGDYVGISAEALHSIDYTTRNKGVQTVAQISGSPKSKAGLGAKIAFSMLFMVIVLMGGIYAYYYKLPQLPEFQVPMPTLFRGHGARGVISRFQRRTDSVVSLTSRRDSTATLRSTAGAFRNPLYDSRRGRVQVTESVAEEHVEDENLINTY